MAANLKAWTSGLSWAESRASPHAALAVPTLDTRMCRTGPSLHSEHWQGCGDLDIDHILRASQAILNSPRTLRDYVVLGALHAHTNVLFGYPAHNELVYQVLLPLLEAAAERPGIAHAADATPAGSATQAAWVLGYAVAHWNEIVTDLVAQ